MYRLLNLDLFGYVENKVLLPLKRRIETQKPQVGPEPWALMCNHMLRAVGGSAVVLTGLSLVARWWRVESITCNPTLIMHGNHFRDVVQMMF
jgi:hypothetical protein